MVWDVVGEGRSGTRGRIVPRGLKQVGGLCIGGCIGVCYERTRNDESGLTQKEVAAKRKESEFACVGFGNGVFDAFDELFEDDIVVLGGFMADG